MNAKLNLNTNLNTLNTNFKKPFWEEVNVKQNLWKKNEAITHTAYITRFIYFHLFYLFISISAREELLLISLYLCIVTIKGTLFYSEDENWFRNKNNKVVDTLSTGLLRIYLEKRNNKRKAVCLQSGGLNWMLERLC